MIQPRIAPFALVEDKDFRVIFGVHFYPPEYLSRPREDEPGSVSQFSQSNVHVSTSCGTNESLLIVALM